VGVVWGGGWGWGDVERLPSVFPPPHPGDPHVSVIPFPEITFGRGLVLLSVFLCWR